MNDLEKGIIRLIAETLELDDQEVEILRDYDTEERLSKWDSAAHVQIIVALEDELGIEIEERDIPRLTNLRKIIDYVQTRG